ncbi:MAG: Hsp33 family molecular chaperone HslO [Methylococcales bacterium]|nr:Hsp33 family molecular chaperone HslO [Methylococcales bacterium]
MTEQHDQLTRFLFADAGVRGVWVQLQQSYRAACQWQTQSEAADQQLGMGLAAVSLLSATIKIQGSVFVQVKAQGWIESLLLQATHQRKVRGMIRTRALPPTLDLAEGQLILTLEPEQGQSYQGVVALAQQPLSAALERYFRDSEQLPTRIWLAADNTRAAGLLLQQIPDADRDDDDWPRLTMLANTLSDEELLTLACDKLLYRLFNQETWQLYPAESVNHFCTCSEQKTLALLRAMSPAELTDICTEQGSVEINCQFCGRSYHYQAEQLGAAGIL